jgi:uncharacterized membrane protein (UPF0127 family)
MAESRVILQSDDGATYHLIVKIAVTPSQRSAGFQHICSEWVRNWGMLFVFPKTQLSAFHMRNVREDLDIAFIAEDGQILELKAMHREKYLAGSRSYHAVLPYRYALETVAGRLSTLELKDRNWWLILDP